MAEKDEKINEVAENIASAIVGDQEPQNNEQEDTKESPAPENEEEKESPATEEEKDSEEAPEESEEESDDEESDDEESDDEESDDEESDDEKSDDEKSDDECNNSEVLDKDDIKEEDKDKALRLLKEVNYFDGCYVGRLFKTEKITEDILKQAAEELMNFPQDLSDKHRECRLLLERIYIK